LPLECGLRNKRAGVEEREGGMRAMWGEEKVVLDQGSGGGGAVGEEKGAERTKHA